MQGKRAAAIATRTIRNAATHVPEASTSSAVDWTEATNKNPVQWQVPSEDLVAQPDPLSNLRPRFYAPLFPQLYRRQNTGMFRHPYSIQEFSTDTDPHRRWQKLLDMKMRLHIQDGLYIQQRYEFDKFNDDFWSKMNSRFLRSKQAFIDKQTSAKRLKDSFLEDDLGVVDLAPFYQAYLNDTRHIYAAYNHRLWVMQLRLLLAGVKASFRTIYWWLAVKTSYVWTKIF